MTTRFKSQGVLPPPPRVLGLAKFYSERDIRGLPPHGNFPFQILASHAVRFLCMLETVYSCSITLLSMLIHSLLSYLRLTKYVRVFLKDFNTEHYANSVAVIQKNCYMEKHANCYAGVSPKDCNMENARTQLA